MFRFTIRDMLWLTVMVAVSVCWWLERTTLKQQIAVMRDEQSALTRALLEKGFFPRLNADRSFSLISIDELKSLPVERASPDEN
jgi:hypothetical protein